ncbi:MAG: glycosyltransferase family 4 protein, partial [Hyphomicrobiales bacterium]
FVLKGYPRLSETFIAQEIRGLEKAGLGIEIVSLRRPYDPTHHPVHEEIEAPVYYLPEYLHDDPVRVFRAWLKARKLPGYRHARSVWAADLSNDKSRNRVRRFGQACVMAAELAGSAERFHAHFIHTPASVTAYASMMTGKPWTCSAHAKDIWTSPDWELAGKLHNMEWVSVCTRYGAEHLASLADAPGKVHLIYHGLDLNRFPPPETGHSMRDGKNPIEPVQLLTVGRAVEKKGLDTGLEALSLLPENLAWNWHHVGGGELLGELKAQAETLGISHRITWHGALAQEKVLELYRECDGFVLPCRVARDGDRDGLPNVLVEAQSQALACVSTPVSGVTELLEDWRNGLLVPPNDAQALAGALEQLICEPALRKKLGDEGMKIVHERFSCETGIAELMALFDGKQEAAQETRGAA